jgi:DNA-binding CsgD family transcriptional regulator
VYYRYAAQATCQAEKGDNPMARTESEQRIDEDLAEAMLARLDELAGILIARHDQSFKDSSLSTLPYEERLAWIKLEMEYLINSIRTDKPSARTNAYRPSATAFRQTSSRIVAEVVNFFDSTFEVEEVVLEILWKDYRSDPERFFTLASRLKYHSIRQVKQAIAQSDALMSEVLEVQQNGMWDELKKRFATILRVSLVPTLSSIRTKAVQLRTFLEQGNIAEALVLTSELKLLSSDALEFLLGNEDISPEIVSWPMTAEAPKAGASDGYEPQREAPCPSPSSHQHKNREEHREEHEASVFLTRREVDIAPYLIEGKSNAEIATALSLSELTVKSYVSNLLAKTQTENRTQLAVYLMRRQPSSMGEQPSAEA